MDKGGGVGGWRGVSDEEGEEEGERGSSQPLPGTYRCEMSYSPETWTYTPPTVCVFLLYPHCEDTSMGPQLPFKDTKLVPKQAS